MNRSSHLSQSNPRIDKLLGETFLSQPVLFAFNFTIFSQNTSFTPISSAGGKAPNARAVTGTCASAGSMPSISGVWIALRL